VRAAAERAKTTEAIVAGTARSAVGTAIRRAGHYFAGACAGNRNGTETKEAWHCKAATAADPPEAQPPDRLPGEVAR
jgi:hypothetical protein